MRCNVDLSVVDSVPLFGRSTEQLDEQSSFEKASLPLSVSSGALQ